MPRTSRNSWRTRTISTSGGSPSAVVAREGCEQEAEPVDIMVDIMPNDVELEDVADDAGPDELADDAGQEAVADDSQDVVIREAVGFTVSAVLLRIPSSHYPRCHVSIPFIVCDKYACGGPPTRRFPKLHRGDKRYTATLSHPSCSHGRQHAHGVG